MLFLQFIINIILSQMSQEYSLSNKSIQNKNASTSFWTLQEEDYIRNHIKTHGVKNWEMISRHLTEKVSKAPRTGKQCRQHYMNFIKFEIKRTQLLSWTADEEKKLFELYQVYGSRWVQISQILNSKSENCLKNKFYGSIRKLIRKINVWGKENKMLKKEMKYESVIKPLEFEETVYQHSYGDSIPLRNLKQDILDAAQDQDFPGDKEVMKSLIFRINKFNLQTRSSQVRKKVQKKMKEYSKNKEAKETLEGEQCLLEQKKVIDDGRAKSTTGSSKFEEKSLERGKLVEKIDQSEAQKNPEPLMVDLTFFEINKSLGLGLDCLEEDLGNALPIFF